MPDDESMDDAVLIQFLTSTTPARPTIDPIAIAFECGRRSATRSTRRWQGATAVATMLTVGVAVWPRDIRWDAPSGAVALVPSVTTKSVETPLIDPGEQNFVALRDVVLDGGIDALPRRSMKSTVGDDLSVGVMFKEGAL